MLRRGLLALTAGSLLLLLALAAPAAAKKPSLFDRILKATTGGRQAQQAGGILTDLLSGELPPELKDPSAFAPKEDAWAVDPELRILSRMMEGDHLGIFEDLAFNKDLQEVWSEPRAVAHILKTMPIFEGIRGVPEIMAKAPEQITKEDVSERANEERCCWGEVGWVVA
jgi:hypothetical protein